MALTVTKRTIVGEVPKAPGSKILVERVSSNIGEHIAVTDYYIPKGGSEFVEGKGKWIPLHCAQDVARLIELATITEMGNV